MTNEELKKIKDDYEQLLLLNIQVNYLKEVKKELEEKPDVIKYMHITNILDNISYHLDSKDIIGQVIKGTHIKKTNKIYVCISAYKEVSLDLQYTIGRKCATDINDPEATCRIYADIEKTLNEGQISITISQCKEFEKNNIVLYPYNMNAYDFYKQTKKQFFENCINEGQEKALEKVLKMKYGK